MGLGKISEAGASLINGATGFLGGLVGNIFQRNNINKQIKAQAKENQKNREYNLMLARMQNDWNLQQYERELADNLAQWNRQNKYDSPVEQMKRFRDASLNANLIYSQLGGGTAMSLPSIAGSMTAGAPSTPQDMSALGSLPTFGDTLTTAIDSAYKGAQISKLRADTQTEDVTRALKVGLMRGQIDLNGWQIKTARFDFEELKPKEKEKLEADIVNIVNSADKTLKEIDKIDKEIAILGHEEGIKAIEEAFKAPEMYEHIRALSAEADIKEKESAIFLQFKMCEMLNLKVSGMKGYEEYRTLVRDNDILDKFSDKYTNLREKELDLGISSAESNEKISTGLAKVTSAFGDIVDVVKDVAITTAAFFALRRGKLPKKMPKKIYTPE